MTAKLEPRHGAWKFIREGQGRGDRLGHTRHSATDGGCGRRLRTVLPAAADRGCGRCYRRLRTAATDGAIGGYGRRLRTVLPAAADGGYGRCYRRRPRTVLPAVATDGAIGVATHDNQDRMSNLQLKSKNLFTRRSAAGGGVWCTHGCTTGAPQVHHPELPKMFK